MKIKLIPIAFAMLLLVGCQTLFTGIVTVTSVVDSAMKNWAQLSNTHQTTPEFDAKVIAAHDKYRKAAATAEILLKSYKVGGQQNDLASALQVAKDGATPLIDLIASIMQPTEAATVKTRLLKASQL